MPSLDPAASWQDTQRTEEHAELHQKYAISKVELGQIPCVFQQINCKEMSSMEEKTVH